MKKSIRKSICSATLTAFLCFIVVSFLVSFFCVMSTGKRYQRAVANSALDFAELSIDAEKAKETDSTREKDSSYDEIQAKLAEYKQNNANMISRISFVSFNSSRGNYIYDSNGETLGKKIEYDEYLSSVKAELINGRNSFEHSENGGLQVFRPMRTMDDNLAGYIIVQLKKPYESQYIVLILAVFSGLILVTVVFVFFLMMFLNRRFFLPLKKLTDNSVYIADIDSKAETKEIVFDMSGKRYDEIGQLSSSLEKIYFALTSGEKDLNQAIYDANHDGMTHVYNKRCYHSMEDNFRNLSSICIIYFDVNNLKLMNDTLGHDKGDYVIMRAAEYIKNMTSENDLCFRMGGDEFLLIIQNCSFREIDNLIERLENDCPYLLNSNEDSVKCALSFGYAYAKNHYSFDELLAEAEDNMYEKKSQLKKQMQMPER